MITAHVLVKNEENFVWYSVVSIINYVDEVMIWDTGSSDKTINIIDELKKTVNGKIIFKKLNPQQFDEGKVRLDMLNETKPGWFIVVDGDEVWWDISIKKVVEFIKENGNNYESIVVPTINPVGDIYHYQSKEAGRYRLAGKVGHLAIRAINKNIPGLSSLGEHGVWGWVDENKKMIQDRDINKIKFIDAPYLHMTHLQRTRSLLINSKVFKRSFKLKHELGISFPLDFYYPEAFFKKRSNFVPNIWKNMSFSFWIRSFIETPLRKINRRYLPRKTGY